MTSQNASSGDFDRLMRQWMDADARVPQPDTLLEAVIERTRGARRIPHWLLPERWIPVQLTMRLQTVPRLAPALLLLIALLLITAAVVVTLGSVPRVPAPFGPAANGILAYDTNSAIYVLTPDGVDARPLVTGVPNAASPTFSPDGTKLAFWGDNAPDSLYVVESDGAGLRKVSGDLWIATNRPPAWSPDSRYIAFSAESGPDRFDERIYVVAASGDSPPAAILPSRGVRGFLPSWSPDGRWIAFVGTARDGIDIIDLVVGLWVVRPDGSDLHSLPTTAMAEVSQPQWWPGLAPRLAYARGTAGGDGQDVFVLDVESGVETPISVDPDNERFPTWSPDGKRLAWLVGAYRTELRIAPIDDPAASRSLSSGFMGTALSWSPDGTKVYADDEARRSISVVAVDGSTGPIHIAHPQGQGLPDWQRLAP